MERPINRLAPLAELQRRSNYAQLAEGRINRQQAFDNIFRGRLGSSFASIQEEVSPPGLRRRVGSVAHVLFDPAQLHLIQGWIVPIQERERSLLSQLHPDEEVIFGMGFEDVRFAYHSAIRGVETFPESLVARILRSNRVARYSPRVRTTARRYIPGLAISESIVAQDLSIRVGYRREGQVAWTNLSENDWLRLVNMRLLQVQQSEIPAYSTQNTYTFIGPNPTPPDQAQAKAALAKTFDGRTVVVTELGSEVVSAYLEAIAIYGDLEEACKRDPKLARIIRDAQARQAQIGRSRQVQAIPQDRPQLLPPGYSYHPAFRNPNWRVRGR